MHVHSHIYISLHMLIICAHPRLLLQPVNADSNLGLLTDSFNKFHLANWLNKKLLASSRENK